MSIPFGNEWFFRMYIPENFVENSVVKASYLNFLEKKTCLKHIFMYVVVTGFCEEIKYSKWGMNFADLLP